MNKHYYGSQSTPMDDFLAHYGILGMKWGVRKNPQKQFYKSMKKEMKAALRENKAAHRTAVSGAKNIGNKLPRNMVRDYIKSQDRMERLISAREKLEDFPQRNYAKTHKTMSKEQLQQFLNKSKRLMNDEDAAYSAHERLMNNARSELLGKYGSKKIRMDSHNTYMKRDANYVLDAAFRSQMPNRNLAGLNSKQKALEAKWKKANQQWRDAPNGKAKRELSESVQKAAGEFFDSMPEKQRRKYHDRYLY